MSDVNQYFFTNPLIFDIGALAGFVTILRIPRKITNLLSVMPQILSVHLLLFNQNLTYSRYLYHT